MRLDLSSDSFNPFKHMNTNHSIWPVFTYVYNLPPWMCMKKSFTFMTVLIFGPMKVGDNIDVYLQPLIIKLKQLWSVQGILTFDGLINKSFPICTVLMWIINNFSAYVLMWGQSTKGELAFSICEKHTRSKRLIYQRSLALWGIDASFIKTIHTEGTVEEGEASNQMSENEVLRELDGLNVKFEKDNLIDGKKRKHRSKTDDTYFNWRKKSIFFDLPY